MDRRLLACASVLVFTACESSAGTGPDLEVAPDLPGTADAFDPGQILPDGQADVAGDLAAAVFKMASQSVSPCGGFPQVKVGTPVQYCDAEVLKWTYDAATATLSLTDARVSLNCCGDHSMLLEGADRAYTATETDAPKNGTGRCKCMCVFDFTASGAPVPAGGPINLTLVRNVTDGRDPSKTVWSGTIDLSAPSGSVVIDASPVVMGCGAT